MSGAGMRWILGVLAITLWAGLPCAAGQQQPTKSSSQGQQQHTGKRAPSRTGSAGTPQASGAAVSSMGASATAKSVPQTGTPTLQNPRPTGTLDTQPNQTLTPGATSVPSNAGGIAPASNDASSGEYTPSEGRTAPTTPGGNPSETQGVPTFSSAAQPANANLPRTVNPASQKPQTASRSHHTRRTRRHSKSSQSQPQ